MIEYLRNLFSFKKKGTSNDYVYLFVKDCKKKHVQLELYYKDKPILIVESLIHVPIWMEWAKVDQSNFRGGYVIHFFISKKSINENPIYLNYLEKKDNLEMIEYFDEEHNLVDFLYFMEEGVEPIELAQKMREIIDGVYRFKEENPQILFNLRYLKQITS